MSFSPFILCVVLLKSPLPVVFHPLIEPGAPDKLPAPHAEMSHSRGANNLAVDYVGDVCLRTTKNPGDLVDR
jgi:hypothetical protein